MARRRRGWSKEYTQTIKTDWDKVGQDSLHEDKEILWLHARGIQNDIDYWIYAACRDLGLIDLQTAEKLMNMIHEEIRKKYEVERKFLKTKIYIGGSVNWIKKKKGVEIWQR